MTKLRVAVIGVGNMGKHHVRNYSEIEGADLVAISDLNEELGEEMAKKFGCKHYKDHMEMMDKEQLDAVTIVVPSRFHHRVGLDAIERGLHVLMEKPLATTVEDAKELIKAAKDKKVKLMVGHIERFNPGVTEIKKLVDSGKLGRIELVIAKRVFRMPVQIKDANVFVDLGVHDIDIISYLLGSYPTRVVANGGKAHLEDRDDHGEILLSFDGCSGFVEINWITPVRIRKLEVTGTGGYAELNYDTMEIKHYPVQVTKTVDDYNDLVVKFGEEPKPKIITPPKHEPMRLEIEAFLNSIIEDKEVPITGEDGLKALETALDAHNDIQSH